MTNKEKIFCEEYVIDWNGTRAAIKAGYSKKTAKEIASQNLTKLHIKSYISEIQQDISKLAGVSALRNVLELKKIAYSNITDAKVNWDTLKNFDDLTDDQKAAFSEITTVVTEFDGGSTTTIKFKMHDKQRAIEILNKMLAFNAPDKHELTGKNGKDLQTHVVVVRTPEEAKDITGLKKQ